MTEASAPLPPFGPQLHALLAAASLAAGAAAVWAAAAAPLFMLLATALGFVSASRLQAVLPAAVNRVCHPLMSSTALISLLLAAYGAASGVAFDALLRAYLVRAPARPAPSVPSVRPSVRPPPPSARGGGG